MESTYVVTGQTTVGVVRHDDDPIMVRKCLWPSYILCTQHFTAQVYE